MVNPDFFGFGFVVDKFADDDSSNVEAKRFLEDVDEELGDSADESDIALTKGGICCVAGGGKAGGMNGGNCVFALTPWLAAKESNAAMCCAAKAAFKYG